MNNALRAIALILKHEGGFVNHPNDPGGATNMGVTLETFRRYIQPGGTVSDLRNLTREQAIICFKRHYWDKVNADLLPVGVDYAVGDYAVNSGWSRAAKHLQACVGVTVDGLVGPRTIEAVNKRHPADVVNDLCDRRMAFLRGLSTWSHFGKGWTRRVSEVRSVALDWAGQTHPPPADHVPAPPKQPSGFWASLVAALAGIFGKDKA